MATTSKVGKMKKPNDPRQKRKVLSADAKAIMVKVHRFLRDELQFTLTYNEGKTDLSHLMNINKRTAEACGVSESTVCRAIEEDHASENSIGRRDKISANIDVKNCRLFRKILLEYYNKPNIDLSVTKIRDMLESEAKFAITRHSVVTIMKSMGFVRSRDYKGYRERTDVVKARNNFLKKMAQFRAEERNIVYVGKMLQYVLWGRQELNTSGRKEFVNEGTKLICILHAVTRYGFVPGAVSFEEIQAEELPTMHLDYWITDVLIPNLPKKSVIVLNSDIYERAWAKDRPDSSIEKAKVIEYMADLKLPNLNCHTKVELLKMIETNLHKLIDFKITRQVRSKGFDILPLPPFHKELNAMESICELVKTPLETANVSAPEVMSEVMNKNVTTTQFAAICDDIEIIENEYAIYSESQEDNEEDYTFFVEVPPYEENYYMSEED